MFTKVNNVVRFFLDNPTTTTHLRDIARRSGYSPAGARKTIIELVRHGIVLEMKSIAVNNYRANRDSPSWLPLKRTHNLLSLYESGLIEMLVDQYEEPGAIILFGSYARGDDTERSDIDIAVFADTGNNADFSKFERRLGRKVHLVETTYKAASKEFLNSLANGIVVHGYFTPHVTHAKGIHR